MAFTLYDHQERMIQDARDLIASRHNSILIQSPTGSGKTVIAGNILETAANRGYKSWFICHRRELIKQSQETFAENGTRFGTVMANVMPDNRPNVQICSIQTLNFRYDRLPPPKLIVWDEAHHVAAGSWSKIHAAFPDAVHIGLTATPQRLDGAGLDHWFQAMVQGPTVKWLIDNKYLCDYRLFAPGGGFDTSNLGVRGGDFKKEDVTAMLDDRPSITGDCVKHYLQIAYGKRALLFAHSVEASKAYVEAFKEAGVTAEHVDAKTPQDMRDAAFARFKSGTTMVLSNVDLFGEGVDVPAAEVAILMRPTKSLTIFLQQCGRVLRYLEGKMALILDHAGNCKMHGLPDDDRMWSLQGTKGQGRGKKDMEPATKTCRDCAAEVPAFMPKCSFCGYVFPIESRQVDIRSGELEEIEKAKVRRERTQENRKAQTMEDLISIGESRGYKNPKGWAKHYFASRDAARKRHAYTVGKALHG